MKLTHYPVIGLVLLTIVLTAHSALGITDAAEAAKPTATPPMTSTRLPRPTATATQPFGELPHAEGAELFARIVYNSTHARTLPDAASPDVMTVYYNDIFPIIDQAGAGNNLWFQIILPDGTRAWVWVNTVELLTVDGERAVAATPTPNPFTSTPTNTRTPTLTRTASATATPSRTRTLPQVTTETGLFVRVTAPSVNVRLGPGTEFDIVTTATVNQEFPVIAQSGTGAELWYQIELSDGRSGWIWGNLVTPIVPDAEPTTKAIVFPTVHATRRASPTPTEEFDIVILGYGESVDETIVSSESDYYVIFGNDGDTVEITMESDNFYPILGLFDVDMNEIEIVWGLDTRDEVISIEYTFEDDGVYFIGAGANSYNDRGAYTLSVERVIHK